MEVQDNADPPCGPVQRAFEKKLSWAGRNFFFCHCTTIRFTIRYVETCPEIISATAVLDEQFPMWLRNTEDYLQEKGVED